MDEATVMRALRGIAAPAGGDLVSAGKVEGVAVSPGQVHVALRATREELPAMERAARQVEQALRGLPGVGQAQVVLTSQKTAAPAGQAAPELAPEFLASVRSVIAVASGKGGVGKSTVAVNLAVALAQQGRRVGLVDADIHGPSLPRMMGLGGARPEIRGQSMLPLRAHGVVCNSIGFLVPEDKAMIWRGPMVMGALTQLLGQTEWGALEVMVVDLPPGTGDAQLTLSQKVRLAGAVIVSTPQDIALLDARRGVAMFQTVHVPILGVVENMSYFRCPHCGEASEIFGHGGARAEAEKLGVPFLGEVPLLMSVREAGDAGAPVVVSDPDGEAALAFRAVAARVMRGVG
jgi:ATP-binding protein involved in chromosome partitioning